MESLLFVKSFVSVILVLTLSAVAEHISPRAAGLLAGFIILAIITTAKLVGSRWAGLLSAFPSTLFPLILIVHLSYDKTHVHTIIKKAFSFCPSCRTRSGIQKCKFMYLRCGEHVEPRVKPGMTIQEFS